jgi:predicted NAD-dependent protein-ADP-ribosyltransferase YbiA (DUF1768 family)
VAPIDAPPATDEPITIHNVHGPYGIFSTLGRRTIVLDGRTWPTVRHFIDATKVADPGLAAVLRKTSSTNVVMKSAQTAATREDWPHIRPDVIRRATRAKIIQHPRLAALLRTTGNRPLILTGEDGTLVAAALMDARAELAKPEDAAVIRARSLLAPQPRTRRWVLFGGRIVVMPRPFNSSMPAVAAFGLLRRCADLRMPANSEAPDVSTWDFYDGTILLHHPGEPPTSSADLAPALPTIEVTHVEWPDATAILPTAR